ncbi:MAG TPA: hypothetical protein VGL46_13320 [Pseudonocardiaceae bacterium]|jgi:hypothetical protein
MALTSTERLLTPAILDTLGQLALGPADAAVEQLAVRLGQQLDDAVWSERGADKIIKAVIAEGLCSGEEQEALDALRRKLSARMAVADLGPKLLAVLEALGATPMARAKIAKLVPTGATGPVPGQVKLHNLQGRVGA